MIHTCLYYLMLCYPIGYGELRILHFLTKQFDTCCDLRVVAILRGATDGRHVVDFPDYVCSADFIVISKTKFKLGPLG